MPKGRQANFQGKIAVPTRRQGGMKGRLHLPTERQESVYRGQVPVHIKTRRADRLQAEMERSESPDNNDSHNTPEGMTDYSAVPSGLWCLHCSQGINPLPVFYHAFGIICRYHYRLIVF